MNKKLRNVSAAFALTFLLFSTAVWAHTANASSAEPNNGVSMGSPAKEGNKLNHRRRHWRHRRHIMRRERRAMRRKGK